MKWKSFRQRQGLILLALVIVPLTIMLGTILPYSRNFVIRRTTDQLEAVADLKTVQVEQWLSQGQEVARLTSSMSLLQDNFPILLTSSEEEARKAAQADLYAEIGAISAVFPSVRSVSLLHPVEGQVLLSTDRAQEGRERGSETYFRDGQQTLYVSQVGYSVGREAPELVVSAPVETPDGELLAVVAVEMDLQDLQDTLASRAGLGQTGQAYLVEAYGFYVTLPSEARGRPLHTIARSEGVRRALNGQNGSGSYQDPRGTQVLGVHRWLPDVALGLLVEMEETELTNQVMRTWLLIIAISLALLALAIFATRYLANWLVSPLEQITETARVLRAGDLSRRAPPSGPDEIGQLATAFNEMADNLQGYSQDLEWLVEQRTAELQSANTELEREIVERKRVEEELRMNEMRLNSLLELSQMAYQLSEQEIVDLTIEEAVALTSSSIGYLHFVNPDEQTIQLVTWSKETLKQCMVVYESHYPIEQAGVWADCVRVREPVVHNDYQNLPNRKGYPEGHTHLIRHTSIPIFDGDKVTLILGVGNKKTDYDETDVLQLRLIGDQLVKILRRKRAEEELKSTLADKDVLLQEIHHRVKNNLQVVSALLAFQAHAVDDDQVVEAFEESQSRIRSMARVHEQLYSSTDLKLIEMERYIQDLAAELRHSYGAYGIALQVCAKDVNLDLDRAIPCGLIVNELVSNAMKHAFPNEKEQQEPHTDEINITLHPLDGVDGQYELIVWDNGIGLPADLDLQHPQSLGLQLVQMLTRQLRGTLQIERVENNRTVFTIIMPPPIQKG